MGIELELGILLVVQIVGTQIFAPFEIETNPVKKILKWLFIALLTIVSFYIIGHWSILVLLFFPVLGLIYHIIFCKKNGIDIIKATPRRKYYDLRGWKWPD